MLKSIINPDLSGKLTKLIFTFLFFIFLSTNLFAQVTQEWASRFDLIFEWDEANSIAVDNTGNVYVTGKSAADPDWYFITIKYNSAGGRQWFKMYGGWGLAIAVDESGNSYVTSENVIIKFNSGGGQQWISSYGGEDIVVDDFGNVYVTGGGLYHSEIQFWWRYTMASKLQRIFSLFNSSGWTRECVCDRSK